MMVLEKQFVSLQEFEDFIQRPENQDRSFEWIGGEIVEVVSGHYSSKLSARIIIKLGQFVEDHDLGDVTSSDGGYIIAGERYIPDVAFLTKDKSLASSQVAYSQVPPDLVVEVLSPTNSDRQMRVKVANYLQMGIVVWLVDPNRKQIEVYIPGQPVHILSENDTLDGGAVLPGFSVRLRDIFRSPE